MTSVFVKEYSKEAQSLIILSGNQNSKLYVRFGAFCSVENQSKIASEIIRIIKDIEFKTKSEINFIISFEFLERFYKLEYMEIKELVIDMFDLSIETFLSSITGNTATLIPMLMTIDKKYLVHMKTNFPNMNVREQLDAVYASRFFKKLEV